MRIKIPLLSRRKFIKKTTAGTAVIAGVIASAPTVIPAPQVKVGKAGQVYPDQRRKYRDSISGRTVWQLTDTPGRNSHGLYYMTRHVTGDGRWLVYTSDRASANLREFNLFKMDLRTGESVQLTESGRVVRDTPVLPFDKNEVYFFDRNHSLRVIDLESDREREICRLKEKNMQRPRHNTALSPDRRFVITARALERKRNLGYQFAPHAIHSALIVIETATGKTRYLFENTSPIGHPAYCPTDPNLISYNIHIKWHVVHRPWLIQSDGTGSRLAIELANGEGAGHEFWSDNGRTFYAVLFDGRQPQGLWGFDVGGGNGRCALAGATIAHTAASPEEDAFVADERFGETDKMWISRKGSPQAEVLCQMADWFQERADGSLQTTRHHPHPRFLPNGQGVTFTNGGEVYLAEV